MLLKIKIIVVDRTRSAFLKEGESFYLKRLRYYVPVEWVEVKPARIIKGKHEEEILGAEGEAIARKMSARDFLVALDRKGDQLDSVELAQWLEPLAQHAPAGVVFLVGGPLGLSRALLERAEKVLSLSRLTLTHEMSRLLLLEQLYRALTILKGEKYHK
jgi:23S rRNA (pseudouridine1915-N3)-methyltransferase